MLVNRGEDRRVEEGVGDCPVVEARTEYSQERCMFVFTVEDRALKMGFHSWMEFWEWCDLGDGRCG